MDETKVVKRWVDLDDPDGFAQIFEMDGPEGVTYAFCTEKRVVLRDQSGDILEELYKRSLPAIDEAVETGSPEPLPFDAVLREMYLRCV